jgi:hypothetical protein
MLFFFKSRKIHLDCFTNRNDVYTYFPIVEGNKTFPDWWKKLPKSIPDETKPFIASTMKHCSGFQDFFSNSISQRLWTDLIIDLRKENNSNNYQYQFSDDISFIDTHNKIQKGDFVDDDQQHFKIDSPWLFSSKEDINWLSIGNCWNENLINKITILSGSINFKYQNGTNINVFCGYPKIDGKERLYLKHGTNLLNYFPLSERPVKIHNHLISDDEFRKIKQKLSKISFVNKYQNIKKIVQQTENKCPFGFK